MDFLDPKKKRAHRIRLYIGYGLMSIALAIATLVLVFSAYGYDIDRHTGTIIQNGLVIIDAHPESAAVLVNGTNKGNTDTRLVLPAGQYKIQLQRNGYRDWTHTLNLEGSSIEQLVYPFLFPSNLVTSTLHTFDTQPSMASTSPDRHWLVVQQPNSASEFEVVDLNNEKNPITAVNLPADTITATGSNHSYEAIEWSTDNTHLLLKHSFDGGSEFVMLDRDNPANSINLNKIFQGLVFSSVSLQDKKADQFYLFDAASGNVYQADSRAKSPALVLSHVLAYKSYQADTLLYATNAAASSSTVEIHFEQAGQDHLLRTVPIAQSYLLDMAQFNGHFYLVAGSPTDGHTYLYKDPLSDFNHHPARTPQPFRVLIVPGSQYVSFSAIARFVAVQGGSSFVGSSRVDLQACKLEYSIVSPK